MSYEFLAKSSGDNPYQVVFIFSDQKLSITCNCKAGIFGKLCKHKTALLAVDTGMLAKPEQSEALREISTKIQATTYPQLIEQLKQAETKADEAKKNLSRVKKQLERSMKEGA